MWTRYHLKCDNCGMITNLRIQIPEKENLPVKFNCGNCSSEIRGTLIVDFEQIKYRMDVLKGRLVHDIGLNDGDYYLEYSDTLPVGRPSKTPHNVIMPTLRCDAKDFLKMKLKKDSRLIKSENEWDLLRDLIKSYNNKSWSAYTVILGKINSQCDPFTPNNDIDYHKSFVFIRDEFVFSWVAHDEIEVLRRWLHKNIFTAKVLSKTDLVTYLNIFDDDFVAELLHSICDLILRFIDLRSFFIYSYAVSSAADSFISDQNFINIKNFYSDCFEFIGRYSHLILRLQNLSERGGQEVLPFGVPRNVSTVSDFMAMDNGKKLDILNLSANNILKKIFSSCFDSRLRNGINHYKTIFDERTQAIRYYPNKNKPEQEFTITYLELLNISLKAFCSVLKLHDIVPFVMIQKLKIGLKVI